MAKFQKHFSEELKFEEMAKSSNEGMADESYYKDPDFRTKFDAPVEDQEEINASK
jgi:hypothetical protein